MNSHKHFIILFFSLLLIGLAVPGNAVESKTSVVLTANMENPAPQTWFDCTDRIYAILTLPSSWLGDHTLEARWIKPNGDLQDRTHINVSLAPGGGRTAYLWLEKREEDESKGRLNRPWKLDVSSDGESVASSTFRVSCN
jgi:hypothetical protein